MGIDRAVANARQGQLAAITDKLLMSFAQVDPAWPRRLRRAEAAAAAAGSCERPLNLPRARTAVRISDRQTPVVRGRA